MEEILQMKEQRAKLVSDARALMERSKTENRSSLNAEEQEQWDKIMKDVDRLGDDIARRERLLMLENEVAKNGERAVPPTQPGEANRDKPRQFATPNERRSSEEYRSVYNTYLQHGFNGFGPQELRALKADSDVAGGYLIAPMQVVNELIKSVDDAVFIRQYATVHPLTEAKSMGIPTLDNNPDDPDWTSELNVGNVDGTMSFGGRELDPHKLSKRVKVSNKLLMFAPNVEGIINDRLAYKFGISEEKAYLTGTGVAQPLGLFTASSDGVSTSRDVTLTHSTDISNTTTNDGDKFVDAFYTLKVQYQATAYWLMHRDVVAKVRKLKDAQDRYLWQPGLQFGQPDQLLGRPVLQSEYAPKDFTTGKYVAMIGDLRFYHIADVQQLYLQRLNELYAESDQTGFIGRRYVDGMPVLEEAFVRLKLA